MTRLLIEAEESGATIVTGLEMFIGQAYRQYEHYTGLPGKLTVKNLCSVDFLAMISLSLFQWFVLYLVE